MNLNVAKLCACTVYINDCINNPGLTENFSTMLCSLDYGVIVMAHYAIYLGQPRGQRLLQINCNIILSQNCIIYKT